MVLGLLTPSGEVEGHFVLDDLQHRLHPLSALAVVPLFALANAGVNVHLDSLRDAASSRVAWGVLVGLVAGKAFGIAGATLLARRLRLGVLPAGVGTRDVIGGAALAGIGFTVALFIADLTFAGTPRLSDAKLAILAASVLAGTVGAAILTGRRPVTDRDFHRKSLRRFRHHHSARAQDRAQQNSKFVFHKLLFP